MYCNECYTFVGISNLTSFYNLVWKRTFWIENSYSKRNTCSIVEYKGNDPLTTPCVSFFRRSRTFLRDKYLGSLWNSLLTILSTYLMNIHELIVELSNSIQFYSLWQNVVLIRFYCFIYVERRFVKKKTLKYLNYKYKMPYNTNALKNLRVKMCSYLLTNTRLYTLRMLRAQTEMTFYFASKWNRWIWFRYTYIEIYTYKNESNCQY